MDHRNVHRELNNWLDQNGYRHAHARKQSTPHPYVTSPRMAHARINTPRAENNRRALRAVQVLRQKGPLTSGELAAMLNIHPNEVHRVAGSDIGARSLVYQEGLWSAP